MGAASVIVGKRNARLVVLARVAANSKDHHALWLCRCDCGIEKVVASNNLRPNGTQSCGCLRREAQRRRIKRDGVWNEGKSYAVGLGKKCYRSRAAWARAAIRFYGSKCQRCGWDKARCDVHHRLPKAQGGLNTLDNAEVLCPNCHRIETERLPMAACA